MSQSDGSVYAARTYPNMGRTTKILTMTTARMVMTIANMIARIAKTMLALSLRLIRKDRMAMAIKTTMTTVPKGGNGECWVVRCACGGGGGGGGRSR